MTRKERLLAMCTYEADGGCWPWTGCKTHNGYGQGTFAQKRYVAHRASYEEFVGKIPAGIFVLHRCDNRACIRPDHLFLGTAADNTADMMAKGRHVAPKKDYCIRKHPMSDSYVSPKGKRNCRECQRMRELKHRGSKRAP
jgi:hypothetical protein